MKLKIRNGRSYFDPSNICVEVKIIFQLDTVDKDLEI